MKEYFALLHLEINLPLLQYLHSFMENKYIEGIVYMMADLPIILLPFILTGYWLYFAYEKDNQSKRKLLFIFTSTLIGIIVNLTVQSQFHFQRPEQALSGSENLILHHIPDASFPSDHACVSIAFTLALWLFGFRVASVALLPVMILMNLARVVAGVHWPFDVLVGMFLGGVSAFFVYKIRNLSIITKVFDRIIQFASYLRL